MAPTPKRGLRRLMQTTSLRRKDTRGRIRRGMRATGKMLLTRTIRNGFGLLEHRSRSPAAKRNMQKLNVVVRMATRRTRKTVLAHAVRNRFATLEHHSKNRIVKRGLQKIGAIVRKATRNRGPPKKRFTKGQVFIPLSQMREYPDLIAAFKHLKLLGTTGGLYKIVGVGLGVGFLPILATAPTGNNTATVIGSQVSMAIIFTGPFLASALFGTRGKKKQIIENHVRNIHKPLFAAGRKSDKYNYVFMDFEHKGLLFARINSAKNRMVDVGGRRFDLIAQGIQLGKHGVIVVDETGNVIRGTTVKSDEYHPNALKVGDEYFVPEEERRLGEIERRKTDGKTEHHF